ncbi:MAG: Mrp/NBP35 family ATP-binding protein [Eubacteriales bacterium]|nr:Mrp/NBP35 family ATP-binding protein [Eubacteriales bacterium]
MSECTHDCGSCGESCAQRDPKSFLKAPNPGSFVKKVIAVVSGKGGVGKSLVTGMSAVSTRRNGHSVAVLDADITGPSVPKMFGLTYRDLQANQSGLMPAETVTGVKVMSMNLLMQKEDDPVIWRSPVITGTLEQFWTEVAWGNVDYMFIDMPPGTGDIPLTVFQSLPIDGIIIVTTPQELVGMIVKKAVGMAKMMNIPILGLVENMSYVKCPHCGEEIRVFGESRLEGIAEAEGLQILGRIPMDPAFAAACDAGKIEYFEGDYLSALRAALPELE